MLDKLTFFSNICTDIVIELWKTVVFVKKQIQSYKLSGIVLGDTDEVLYKSKCSVVDC